MKDRGFTTVDSRKMTKIFTLLASACYRASDSTMAIDRATYFLDEMKTKGMYVSFPITCSNMFSMNIVEFQIDHRTYNALIAAYGKHGQLKMAFQIADEMVEMGLIPNEDTYASLFIACNAEKSSGFKYAIEVRRKRKTHGEMMHWFRLDLASNAGFWNQTNTISFWPSVEYYTTLWSGFTEIPSGFTFSSTISTISS